MNARERNLKKFYYLLHTIGGADFTYYINDDVNNTIATEFYFGQKSTVKIPQTIDGMTVTELSGTTFCGKSSVNNVTLTNDITKID